MLKVQLFKQIKAIVLNETQTNPWSSVQQKDSSTLGYKETSATKALISLWNSCLFSDFAAGEETFGEELYELLGNNPEEEEANEKDHDSFDSPVENKFSPSVAVRYNAFSCSSNILFSNRKQLFRLS